MLYIVAHLFGLASLGGLVWVTGRLVRCHLRLDSYIRPLWVADCLLGAAAWTAMLFALGTVGGLRPWPMAAVAGALTVVGLAQLLPGRAVPREEMPWPRIAAPALVLGLAVLLLGLVLFPVAINPAPAWDANVYHLAVPKAWLSAGSLVRVPLNVYSVLPMNVQLLYGGALAVGGAALAATVHWAAGMLLALVLLFAVRRGEPTLGGAVAATLVIANPTVLFELRAAYADLAMALALLAAYLLLEPALEGSPRARALLPAGLALGYVTGMKVSGFATTGVLAAVALFVWMRRGDGLRAAPALVMGLVGPAGLLALPWLLRSALLTGSPVYPALYGFWGGPEWSEELTAQLLAWQRSIGMGRSLVDTLLLPWRVIAEGGLGYARFDGRLGWGWIVAVPLALRFARGRPEIGRPLGAGGLLFVLWALSSQQIRLLLPALPLLALAAGRAAQATIEMMAIPQWRRFTSWALAVAGGLALGVAAPAELSRVRPLVSAYLAHGFAVRERAVPEAFRWADENLPREARLLLVNTNQGLFSPRPYLADSFFEASQISHLLRGAKRADEASAALRALHVTHLLVDSTPRGTTYPSGLVELLSDESAAPTQFQSADGRLRIAELR